MKRSHGWQETSWGGLCDGREWKNGAGGGCRLPLLTYTHDKFTSPFQCMAWRRFRCRTRKWVKSNEHCKCCNTLHRREVRDTHTHRHTESRPTCYMPEETWLPWNVTSRDSSVSFTCTPSSACFYWNPSSLPRMLQEIINYNKCLLSPCTTKLVPKEFRTPQVNREHVNELQCCLSYVGE
jgi:hypothetical protein